MTDSSKAKCPHFFKGGINYFYKPANLIKSAIIHFSRCIIKESYTNMHVHCTCIYDVSCQFLCVLPDVFNFVDFFSSSSAFRLQFIWIFSLSWALVALVSFFIGMSSQRLADSLALLDVAINRFQFTYQAVQLFNHDKNNGYGEFERKILIR